MSQKVRIKLREKATVPYSRKPENVKLAIDIVKDMLSKNRNEIEGLFREAVKDLTKRRSFFIEPKTLFSILSLISPRRRHVKSMQITYDDLLKDIPEKLEILSFRIGIKEEVTHTFNALKDKMLKLLEEKGLLHENLEELRDLVAFYLLLELAPNVLTYC